jgi:four helix bundle protein
MSTYSRFEDLPVWQNSRCLAKEVDDLVWSTKIHQIFKFRDQVLGSSGSIMDNIAEGFERNGNGEFVAFLYYAKGSAGELRSQLYRAFDGNYISKEQFEELKTKVELVSKELQGFSSYLEKSDRKGQKFDRRMKK